LIGSILAVLAGLVLLMVAADRLVVAAVRVSQALGLSAILIGGLVVGMGTSIPELLVSAIAAAENNLDVAMANVVGSNIANVTLVLGAATLVAPVTAKLRTLNREGVLMLVAVMALFIVLIDGEVGAYEGGFLLFGLLIAFYLLVRWAIADADVEVAADATVSEVLDGRARPLVLEIAIGLAALAVTVFAADLLLDGALDIGEELGLSSSFLGVMLGVGTSLPELATAVAAIRRGESDLVVGNVLGSNLFNSLAVAGSAAVAGSGPLLDLDATALWLMIVSAVMAGLMLRTGQRITRREGGILVVFFIAFATLTF
jgi:cation:H+ antiporter